MKEPSSHAARLESAGDLEVQQSFRDRNPPTTHRITKAGRAALAEYRRRLTAGLGQPSARRPGQYPVG